MPTIIDNGNTHITIKTITARDYDLGTYSLILPAGSQPSEDDWDMISIEIKRPGEEERILVVSETSSFDEDCAVLNSNALSVLQGWTIYHIDVDNSTLLSTTELDTVCPNFSLYRIQDGYIVFGEIDVTMLDQKFDFVWSFSGHDVFCPMEEGLKPIELCDDRIKLFDFNGDYYELSYRGELITYRKSATSGYYVGNIKKPPFEGYDLKNYKRLKPNNPKLSTLGELFEILRHCWKAETAYPSDQEDWTEAVPSYGQCAITAMLVYDLFGGEMYRTKDHAHYYNRIDGHWVDLTAEQFWVYGDECDYAAGERIERRFVGQSGHTKQRYDLLVKNIKKYLDEEYEGSRE